MTSSVSATLVILLVISFSAWFGSSFWRLARNTLACDSPTALRADAERRCTVFGACFVVSLIGFVLIPVTKALLLLKGLFQETWLTWIAFGNGHADTFVERFGYTGIAMVLIGVLCIYQYLRSMHHRQVLYALHRFIGKSANDVRVSSDGRAK
jgi:sterol desaturase/sphingolipid hydroxylase (fatty acid hydroxylase superfamily)